MNTGFLKAALCLGLITGLMSSQADAKKIRGTIILTSVVKTSNSEYQREGGSDKYKQVTSVQVSDTILKGTGDLSSFSQVQKDQIDTKVPGIDYRGHSYMHLEKVSEKEALVVMDAEIHDKVDGIAIDLAIKYKAPAKFEIGSWSAYEQGEQVALVLTKEGQAIALKNLIKKLESAMDRVSSALKNQLSGAKIGKISLEKLTHDRAGVISGDRNQLTSTGTAVTISLSIKIKAKISGLVDSLNMAMATDSDAITNLNLSIPIL